MQTWFLLHCYKYKFKYQVRVSSAGHESQPLKHVTDAGAAVRGTQDPLDAGQDVKVVPAIVPRVCDKKIYRFLWSFVTLDYA